MLNSLDGRIKANAAIVQAGTEGAVSVYVTNTTNVVIDIDGYFVTPSDSTLAFYPITPCRIADTRPSSGFVQPFGTSAPFRRHAARFPDTDEPVQHPQHGAGLFAQLGGDTLSTWFGEPIGLPGGVAEGPDAAEPSLHAE